MFLAAVWTFKLNFPQIVKIGRSRVSYSAIDSKIEIVNPQKSTRRHFSFPRRNLISPSHIFLSIYYEGAPKVSFRISENHLKIRKKCEKICIYLLCYIIFQHNFCAILDIFRSTAHVYVFPHRRYSCPNLRRRRTPIFNLSVHGETLCG